MMKRVLLVNLDKQIEFDNPDSSLTQHFKQHVETMRLEMEEWAAETGIQINMVIEDVPDPNYSGNKYATRLVTMVYAEMSEDDHAWFQFKMRGLKPARAIGPQGFLWDTGEFAPL